MKKLKQITLFTLALLSSSRIFAMQPDLKIYSGVGDTLFMPYTEIIAVTTPGSVATINGEEVKVYKTGSFGKRLELTPGDNLISIISEKDGEQNKIERTIYYKTDKFPSKKVDASPRTLYFTSPIYVMTLPGAYLQYGNGDDRLGGSKMGFIDADIPLKVVGEAGSLYCVRLSSSRIAYIPKEYVVTTSQMPEVVNTGSWSVTNMGNVDRVVVSLPCRLPYQYSTSINPQEIYVDLFGATDNSNWITQRSASLGAIDYVDFEQVAEDVYRIILRLKDKYQWGYSISYEGNNLIVDVRHQPLSLKLKDLTIGLDAGHGGAYPGAISPSGINEKDVNLDIVLRMRKLLEKKGAKVVLTREDDSGPSMTERKEIWRKNNVEIAISVHNNSGGSPLASPGTSVLYKHLSNRPLAEALLHRMLETGLPLFGLVGNFNFSLNAPTDCPNALIEGVFMSSLEEEEKLADPDFRQLVAEKIILGLEDYLKSAVAR